MPNNCPSCKQHVSTAIANEMLLMVPGGKTWNGLSYVCPHCQTILGVQMDPIAVKTDTVSGVVAALRKGSLR